MSNLIDKAMDKIERIDISPEADGCTVCLAEYLSHMWGDVEDQLRPILEEMNENHE